MIGIVSLAVGGLFGILYCVAMADYFFPGESVRLAAAWCGLGGGASAEYPLLRSVFVAPFGAPNGLFPLFGALAVTLVCFTSARFVRARVTAEDRCDRASALGIVAGVVSAAIFATTPAVLGAATHLEPRIFDFLWVLLAVSLFSVWTAVRGRFAALVPVLIAALLGVGVADSPLALFALPLAFLGVWTIAVRQGKNPMASAFGFVIAALAALALFIVGTGLDVTEVIRRTWRMVNAYWTVKGWIFVGAFATLPCLTAFAASRKGLNEPADWSQLMSHLALSFATILAVATPLAPSSVLEPYGILPVATSAFVALTAGYLIAYWWLQFRLGGRAARLTGCVACGILALVCVLAAAFNLQSFDPDRGAFADAVARRVLSGLDGRDTLVVDGTLDDHFRLVSAFASPDEKGIWLLRLGHDMDRASRAAIAQRVRTENLGGERSADLALSAELGLLPFLEDWFAADPSAARRVAVLGSPDVWYSADVRAVPEFLTFGSDPERTVDWTASWRELGDALHAPKGWGSRSLSETHDPVERLRLGLRRYSGLVANDRGVWLQERGREDEAFALYALVLDEIDADNVSALFNAYAMALKKHPKAVGRKGEFERKIKRIVDDKRRRYQLWTLSNHYGYICDPRSFVDLGFAWARSGRPGGALGQVRRAIDLIPSDRRNTLVNMMAALYAADHDAVRSRALYESVLGKNAEDHDALVGLMRLELDAGNGARALEYLDRAAKAAGDDEQADLDRALAHLMRGSLDEATALLRKATDRNPENLRTWSLLAAALIQRCDAAKTAEEKRALTRELEDVILPQMEKNAKNPNDYYVQMVRAFVFMRQGVEKRRAARDALASAARGNPAAAGTRDMLIGLDILLGDPAAAELHAREALARDRRAPLANYVMGSLALQKDDLAVAETYLRRSVDTANPPVLALNDLAEVLRRRKILAEAETYARQATEAGPGLSTAWETLGSVLMDAGKGLDEAEACITKACELSRIESGGREDARLLMSLARIQLRNGDKLRGNGTLRKVVERKNELSAFELNELEELRKGAR